MWNVRSKNTNYQLQKFKRARTDHTIYFIWKNVFAMRLPRPPFPFRNPKQQVIQSENYETITSGKPQQSSPRRTVLLPVASFQPLGTPKWAEKKEEEETEGAIPPPPPPSRSTTFRRHNLKQHFFPCSPASSSSSSSHFSVFSPLPSTSFTFPI